MPIFQENSSLLDLLHAILNDLDDSNKNLPFHHKSKSWLRKNFPQSIHTNLHNPNRLLIHWSKNLKPNTFVIELHFLNDSIYYQVCRFADLDP